MIKVPRILSAILVAALLLMIAHSALALPQEEPGPSPPSEEEGILKSIENTALAAWIRESPSVFAFAGILLLHTIGMGLVVGICAGLDLRILGVAREIPLAPMRRFFPVLWVGFFLNAATGLLLLYADLSTKLINPDFWAKIVFIALAVVTLLRLKKLVFNDPDIDHKPLPANAKLLAFISLILWIGAVTAGRLMAYIGPVSGLGF
ncbi:MAG TPA: hypothetical protein VFY29_04265 [Terriglobia bacterium]|nr:hypothetical protein [Terriglobia bacterium]